MRAFLENSGLAYAVVYPLLAVLVLYQVVQAVVPPGRHRRRHHHRWWLGVSAVPLTILLVLVVSARFMVLG
jgi:hypothetical protein